MLSINSNSKTDLIEHKCTARQKGDWVIYKCTECDYELWDNWKTGELKVFNSNVKFRHSGSFIQPAFHDSFFNAN